MTSHCIRLSSAQLVNGSVRMEGKYMSLTMNNEDAITCSNVRLQVH